MSTVEPVAWQRKNVLGKWVPIPDDMADAKTLAVYRDQGYELRPLYAATTTSTEPDAVREALSKRIEEAKRQSKNCEAKGYETRMYQLNVAVLWMSAALDDVSLSRNDRGSEAQ